MAKTTSKVQTSKTAPSRLVASAKKPSGRSDTALTAAEQREVEQLAYGFYEQRGFQHGNDREDWLRAEAIVRSRRS